MHKSAGSTDHQEGYEHVAATNDSVVLMCSGASMVSTVAVARLREEAPDLVLHFSRETGRIGGIGRRFGIACRAVASPDRPCSARC